MYNRNQNYILLFINSNLGKSRFNEHALQRTKTSSLWNYLSLALSSSIIEVYLNLQNTHISSQLIYVDFYAFLYIETLVYKKHEVQYGEQINNIIFCIPFSPYFNKSVNHICGGTPIRGGGPNI